MNYLGDFPVGATVYVPFHTFNAAGGSVTLSGLAVTDIEIYKDGSTTQRSSDAGYTLLDTDGIDFDGITGLHGFKIDLSNNTDSGFFAAGHEYMVAVSAVTVDGQTVNFWSATFSIERAGAALTVGAIVNGVWDELVENHENGDTMGYVMTIINNNTVAINVAAGVWTAALPGAYTAGQAGHKVGTYLDAAISDIPTATENADALLKRDWTSVTGEAARSVLNALRLLRNKWGVSGSTLTVTKEDDTTTAWTAAVTGDAGADPVTGVDPS